MLAAAAAGLVANAVYLLLLRARKADSLNVRGAYLEVLGDLLRSLAVIVAGIVIVLTGYTRADVIASVTIGLMILPRAWSLLRDVVDDDCLAGRSGQVLDQLGACLTGHSDVEHCTFQLEPVGHSEHESAHHR